MFNKDRRIRVMVTGGGGMLGADFARETVHFPQFEMRSLTRHQLDVCDQVAVDRWGEWVAGGWIVHCAALVDVEGCYRDPETAREIIVEGTRNVARMATRVGARVFYPQSFLIYDGSEDPVSEECEPRPLCLYGELKTEAERIVAEEVAGALMVRMAGFFGGGASDKNFVGRIIPVIAAAIDRGEKTFAVGDRVWQPTWTKDLAFNSLHLMTCNSSGFYQMASNGEATFFEIAQIIIETLGWSNQITIEQVSESAVSKSELGRRPHRAVLSCDRLKREDANLQRCWRSTLRAYLNEPFFDRYRAEALV